MPQNAAIKVPLPRPGSRVGPGDIAWVANSSAAEWDQGLACLRGHPLQSAVWGEARRRAGEPQDLRLMAVAGGEPLCMARVEQRVVPFLGRTAWIPKGPVYAAGAATAELHAALLRQLRRLGFILVLETPYRACDVAPGWDHQGPGYQTMVVDLQGDCEAIWSGLPNKLRSQIRSAERKGVVVAETSEETRIEQFYALCSRVSKDKGFVLPGSRELMRELLLGRRDAPDSPTSAQLLAAVSDGKLVAAHVFMRVGTSTHTLWAGHDRAFGVSGASDLVVWKHMRDSITAGCTRFDQEGIDKGRNPSTYAFKRKFGGTECEVPGMHAYVLSLRGRIALAAGRRLGRL